ARNRSMPLCSRCRPPVSTTIASVDLDSFSGAGRAANQIKPATHSRKRVAPAIAVRHRAPETTAAIGLTACAKDRAARWPASSRPFRPKAAAMVRCRLALSSAADGAVDQWAEQLPTLAVEAGHLDLLDRGEIGGAGVDRDPGQQHRHPEAAQIGR